MDDASKVVEVEQLRTTGERFWQMADAVTDAFFLIDAQTDRLLYANRAYQAIWGSLSELADETARFWTEAIHADDRGSANASWEIAKSGDTPRFEFRVLRDNGTTNWMEARCFPVRDDAGNVIRIGGVVRDIDDLKQSERKLQESERRFGEMLRHIALAAVTLDRDARITFINDYLLDLSGWRREEVMGRNWFELFIPSQFDGTDFFAGILDNTPSAWHRENEILQRSGGSRRMRWHSVVLRSVTGDVIGSASIGEDVTERQLAEDLLTRRAAELERFHRLSVGRELRMVELKKQINLLAAQAGQAPPYDMTYLTRVLAPETRDDGRTS